MRSAAMWSVAVSSGVIPSSVTVAMVAAGVVLGVRAASDRDVSTAGTVLAGVGGAFAGSLASAAVLGILGTFGTFGTFDGDARADLRRGIIEAGGTTADAAWVTRALEDRHGNLEAALQRIEADVHELLAPMMRCQGHGADSDARARCLLDTINARASTPVVGANDLNDAVAVLTPDDRRAVFEGQSQCVGLSEPAPRCVSFRMRSTLGPAVFDTRNPVLSEPEQRELDEILRACAANN